MNASQIAERVGRIVNLKAFSKASGIARRTLYTVKQGTNEPSAETLRKIEQALGELKPAMKPKARK